MGYVSSQDINPGKTCEAQVIEETDFLQVPGFLNISTDLLMKETPSDPGSPKTTIEIINSKKSPTGPTVHGPLNLSI